MTESSRRRGFTLVESMITMLLVCLLLGVIGSLAKGYADFSRFSSLQDRSVAARGALSRIAQELRDAITVASPTGAATSLLRFDKVNPAISGHPARSTDRLPDPLVLPGSYDPVDPAHLVTVSYSLTGTTLERRVTDGSGTSDTQPLVEDVNGFSAALLGNGNVQLKLSVLEATRVEEFTTHAFMPLKW